MARIKLSESGKNAKNAKVKKTGEIMIDYVVYAFDLGNGIVKLGCTNNLDRRAQEHKDNYRLPAKPRLIDFVKVTHYSKGNKAEQLKARNKAELIELQLMKNAGELLEMVCDSQKGDTERFYSKPEVLDIPLKIRKDYRLKVR